MYSETESNPDNRICYGRLAQLTRITGFSSDPCTLQKGCAENATFILFKAILSLTDELSGWALAALFLIMPFSIFSMRQLRTAELICPK
ncbi:MAG: hypothetical protein HGA22_12965 [Clostridiales bacterium]|jgi:hypothetical protein|nr:hypothetical protein [Clostridiales bacterium]